MIILLLCLFSSLCASEQKQSDLKVPESKLKKYAPLVDSPKLRDLILKMNNDNELEEFSIVENDKVLTITRNTHKDLDEVVIDWKKNNYCPKTDTVILVKDADNYVVLKEDKEEKK